MVDVNYVASWSEVPQRHRVAQIPLRARRPVASAFDRTEQLRVAVNRNRRFAIGRLGLPAAAQRSGQHLYPACPRSGWHAVRQRRGDAGLFQDLDQPRGMLGHRHHRAALGDPLDHIVGKMGKPRAPLRQRLQRVRRLFGAPALHAHHGYAGSVHSFGDASPIRGRRWKTVRQFTAVLPVAPLLLVLRLLLFCLP